MKTNLVQRPRRLRRSEGIRRLVKETYVNVDDLIFPIFVTYGENIKAEISSMPGNYHWSLDRVLEEVDEIVKLGIPGILLFGIPETKDEIGSSAWVREASFKKPVERLKKHILIF